MVLDYDDDEDDNDVCDNDVCDNDDDDDDDEHDNAIVDDDDDGTRTIQLQWGHVMSHKLRTPKCPFVNDDEIVLRLY